MTTTAPETMLKQAQNRARQFLDTNNSLTGKISGEMISLLEAGEGSFLLRNQIDNFLNNITKTDKTIDPSYSRPKLRQLFSIKDKIAYIASYRATDKTNAQTTNIVDEKDVKDKINETIKKLETGLLNNQEFTESWILRHAAINRFACHLETQEKANLNTFAGKIKKLCETEGFDILSEAVHFTFESDAQKIMKMNEVISQLSAMGTTIPPALLEEFSGFEKHIEKLKDLDKSYKHLTKTLNMIHKVAKTTEKSMISPKQQKIVKGILEKMDMKASIDKSIVDFNDPSTFEKNEEHTYLDNLLHSVRKHPQYLSLIEEEGLEEKDFSNMFSSWMGFELTHGAHTALSLQKGKTFGDKLKDFEDDTQSWRGMMRKRIFNVYDKNKKRNGEESSEWDFASDEDYNQMNSYFTKFPDLFFAKDEDNYRTVDGVRNANNPGDSYELHFDKMRSVLAAIIRRKTPALRSSDKIRNGHFGKKVLDWADHAFKGKDRGIFNMIERYWNQTDDASIIAMTIMLKNNATNKMFYEDKDPFEKKERWYSKIFKSISGFERGRQAISKTFAPAASTALKGAEVTAKGALSLGAGLVQKGSSLVNVPLDGINTWLSKQSNRNPIKLGMLATKPMQWIFNPLGKGFTYTDKEGNEKKMTIKQAIDKGYTTAKEALPDGKEHEEKKTKYLFEWVTRGIGKVSEFFGESVAGTGQWMYDVYTTDQQQGVLGAFYDAAHKEGWYNDLMTSQDIANALNLKVRGPSLFDEDGRILPIDKPEEKYPEDQAGIEKLGKDIFGKQYDDIQGQISTFYEDLRKKYETLDRKMDDVSYGTPEYEAIKKQLINIAITNDAWKDSQGTLNKLLISIQKTSSGSFSYVDFVGDIIQTKNNVKDLLDKGEKIIDNNSPANPGLQQKLKKIQEKIKETTTKKTEAETGASALNKLDLSSEDLKKDIETSTTTIEERETKHSENKITLGQKASEKTRLKETNNKLEERIIELNKERTGFKAKEEISSTKKQEIINKEAEVATLKNERRKSIDSIKTIDAELEKLNENTHPSKNITTQKQRLEAKRRIENKKIEEKDDGIKKNKILIDKLDDEVQKLDYETKQKDDKISDILKEQIQDLEKEVIENNTSLTGIDIDLNTTIPSEQADLETKIRKETAKKQQLEAKLAAKGPHERSWVDYNKEKTAFEREIMYLEIDQKALEADIEKQEIKNKVYRKILRWTEKLNENGNNLIDLDKQAEGQKEKLLKKALQNMDLSFEKKAASTPAPETREQTVSQTNNALTGALGATA